MTSEKSAVPGPGPGRGAPLAADQVQRPRRLDVAAPQAGGGSEVDGVHRVLGETGQHPVAAPHPAEGAGQVGEDRVQDRQLGGPRWGVEPGVGRTAQQRCRVTGRWRAQGVLVGRPGERGHVDLTPPAGHARRRPSGDLGQGDHRDPPVASHPVGGGGVVGEADLGLARLLHQDHPAVLTGGRQRLLQHLGRRGEAGRRVVAVGAHRPPSWRALRMLTWRTSTLGHPWLTGATCPGWPLPQLKAPPSR